MKKSNMILLLVLIVIICFGNNYAEASQLNVKEAETLNVLGLFMGTENGFELDKVATRAESATMLVRLLGAEKEAKDNKYKHPFTDVPKWADEYIGYMYENGLTSGIGGNKFGSSDIIDGKSYATFVLRALGYDDSKGDFTWENALKFALSVKLIDKDELNLIEDQGFKRNELVLLSYNSLQTKLKDKDNILIEDLMIKGIIRPYIGYDSDLVDKDKYATVPLIVKDSSKGVVFDMKFSEIVGMDIKDSYMIFRTDIGRNPLDREGLIKKMTVIESKKDSYKGYKKEAPHIYDPELVMDLINFSKDDFKSIYSIVIFYDENINPTHYFEIPNIPDIGVYNLPIIPIENELNESLKEYINDVEAFTDGYMKKLEVIPQDAITIEMGKGQLKNSGSIVPYAKINRELLPLSMKDFTDITTMGTDSRDMVVNMKARLRFIWDKYNGIFHSNGEYLEGDRVEIKSDYRMIFLQSEEGELLGYTAIDMENKE